MNITHNRQICSEFHNQIVGFFTIFSLTARVLRFVTTFTMPATDRSGTMRGMDMQPLQPVPTGQYHRLLALVPDAPQAAMARAALLARRGAAWADDAEQPTAAAIQTTTPDGPTIFLFGDTPHMHLPEPRAFAAFTAHADTVQPFIALPPGGVRRLRPNDARHLASFPPWLWGIWVTPDALLREAPAYARYLRGELASLACVAATTERYDAIGVYTIERTRRNGFARECAARLCGAIAASRGKLPVLLTTADDTASIALAHSLGLTARTEIVGYVDA